MHTQKLAAPLVATLAAVLAGAMSVLAAPQPCAAQTQAPPRKLAPPTATLDQDFTGIDAVSEFRDGRVILLDARDKALHLIDLKTKTDTRLGRDGDGPGEFRLIQRFFRIGGDSVGMSDMARGGKLMVLTPAGELGGFVSMLDSSLSTRSFVPMASDNAGRLYSVHTTNPFTDSTAIVRWDRARGRRDTVAKLMMTPVSPLYKGPPEVRQVGDGYVYRPGPILPFSTTNQWAISGDGRVAIVDAREYRVTLTNVNGARVRGQPIPFTPVVVGEAEKAAFIKDLDQPRPGVRFAGRGQPAEYGFRSSRTPPEQLPTEWPPTLPAFGRDALTFASDGMLWVKRATAAGAPALYDVVDRGGNRAYQLELPAGRKLIGFGAGTVYLARVDSDDLHYLERYKLP